MPIIIAILALLALWVLWLALKFTWIALLCSGFITLLFHEAKHQAPRRFRFSIWFVAIPTFLVSLLIWHVTDSVVDSQNATRQEIADARARAQEKLASDRAHQKRLAWNLSHPAEVAAKKAIAQKELARQYAASLAAAKETARHEKQVEYNRDHAYDLANADLANYKEGGDSYYKDFEEIDGKPVLVINGDVYYSDTDKFARAVELRSSIRAVGTRIWRKYSDDELFFRVDCLLKACADENY